MNSSVETGLQEPRVPFVNGSPSHEKFLRYQRALGEARSSASVVGYLHCSCRFISYYSLTWGTVVVLGGFVSALSTADFGIVTILLILEIERLISVTFLNRPYRALSERMKEMLRSRGLCFLAEMIQELSLILVSEFYQLAFVLPSIVFPLMRLRRVDHTHSATPNAKASLHLFYCLVLLNAACALYALIVSASWKVEFMLHKKEQSIGRYYDDTLQSKLDGIFQGTFANAFDKSNDLDFLNFAFKMLGKEFAEKFVRQALQELPTEVGSVFDHHKNLLLYIYHHSLGVDVLQAYMDGGNTTEQLAAVSVVGFWGADPDLDQLMMRNLPKSLFTKLADKLRSSQVSGAVGWAAANTWNALARLDPRVVWETKDSNGTKLLHSLIEMLDPSTSRSMVLIEPLIRISIAGDTMLENKAIQLMKRSPQLETKLQLMTLRQEADFENVKVLACFLLMRLNKLDHQLRPWLRTQIEALLPTEQNDHTLLPLELLNRMLERIGLGN